MCVCVCVCATVTVMTPYLYYYLLVNCHCHSLERLQRLIIFPIPKAALNLYHAIKWVFHANVIDKIVLIPGPAEKNSPLPIDYLREYMDISIVEFMEKKRIERYIITS